MKSESTISPKSKRAEYAKLNVIIYNKLFLVADSTLGFNARLLLALTAEQKLLSH
jgi:hypothetical protein